jgi:hypothetical protein
MSRYLFVELNESPEKIAEYESYLRDYSAVLDAAVDHLARFLQLVAGVDFKDKLLYRGVVIMLARHVAEEIDAASILVERGSVQPCKSHLRSAFEAELGIRYILETDHERRATGYLVKHIKDKLRTHNKVDPFTQQGKQFRKETTDPLGQGILTEIENSGFDFEKDRNRYERLLAKPEYVDVDNQWKAAKKVSRGQPPWFSLFNGPKNVRKLAESLGRGFWYEFLYSDWSGHIHAGSSIGNIGKNSDDETGQSNAFRPIRHPEEIKNVINFGTFIPCALANDLSRKFLSQIGQDDVRRQYIETVKPLNDKVKDLNLRMNWK